MKHTDRIRNKIKNGELCFGTHCSTTEPWYYEMCGLMGYDYVWIDNEHAGMTMPMVQNAIVATNAGNCAAIVRVQDHDMKSVKPVLEVGPDGIIFPMVNTAEEARNIVSMCKYPPRGIRGFGPLRAINYSDMPLSEYLAQADDSILLLMQCETKEAVDNLEDILAVDGVDAIIVGPMDLSASIGKMGQLTDPEVMALFNTIIAKCKKAGKPFGVSIGVNYDLVKFWVNNGASFASMGTPADYFYCMGKEVISTVRGFERERLSK